MSCWKLFEYYAKAVKDSQVREVKSGGCNPVPGTWPLPILLLQVLVPLANPELPILDADPFYLESRWGYQQPLTWSNR